MKLSRNSVKALLVLSLFMFISLPQFAQENKLQPFAPGPLEMQKRYKEADDLDLLSRSQILNTEVVPFWNADGHSFWYKKRLKGGQSEFIYADVLTGVRKIVPASDTSSLKHGPASSQQNRRNRWQGNSLGLKSPDGKWKIFVRSGNIFLADQSTSNEEQVTFDGKEERPWGNFSWSPDGKNIIAYLISPKKIEPVFYVLSSVPGTTRGQLKSHEYAQPGDAFTSYEPYIINVASKKKTKVDSDFIDFLRPGALHWRNNNSRYFVYEQTDRGHQRFRLIEVDVLTGKTRNIIDEKSKTFIYEQRIFTYYLPKSDEVVWTSEQDGYRHMYLVNMITGRQQQITKGDWVVRDVDSVDAVKREILFRASGVVKGEDPYNIHYYRIGFDGKRRMSLSPELGNHQVRFSPDKKYYLDTYWQVNVAPVTVCRRTSDAKLIMELERGDVKAFLNAGLRLPEVFVSKGRDGNTDIWGVVWQPVKMDTNKTYPVIEYIYAGPHDSFVPKNFLPHCEMQSLANLGFIVVQIDGMGTANRSKAFHDVCWKNLADAGFPDRILWMKAMSKKYRNADVSKVGIYGTSAGGQNSTGALLFHPEFYKVAVSSCGCHDNRIDKQWWNEQWMGYPVGPHYDAQSNITNASKLQGSLLLIVGEADENVPPESTFRLADALIKADKDFDFLCIPGMGHSEGGTYGRRRRRDFFVKKLLNATPPERNAVGNNLF